MLETLKNFFQTGFSGSTVVSIIDILITAIIIYAILTWIKDTQAIQVVKGIVIIVVATQLSSWLGLTTINYILKNVITVGILALVIMFQPELRRALGKIGSTKFKNYFSVFTKEKSEVNVTYVIEQIVSAVFEMSKSKTGALIVLERNTKIKEIIDSGTAIDSLTTKQLLLNIFIPNTPLHDGAAVIGREDMRIKAAGCLLPLTQNNNLKQEIGTRHRSAIGMSEVSDSFVIVVSEETGVVSYALGGKLSRFLDAKTLTELLNNIYAEEDNILPTLIGETK